MALQLKKINNGTNSKVGVVLMHLRVHSSKLTKVKVPNSQEQISVPQDIPSSNNCASCSSSRVKIYGVGEVP